MNYKVLAAGLVVVVPMLAVFAHAFGTDPHALPKATVGKPAPGFVLETLTGETVDERSLQDHPFVINFWATWCVPCAQEHPTMLAVAQQFRDRIPFYGVLYGDEKDNAIAYLQKRGQAFPTLLDPSGRTAIDYGVSGVPETFVVDKGRIVKKYVGPIDGDEMVALLGSLR